VVSRLIIALDVDTEGQAIELARRLEPAADGFKVGLQLLMAAGPRVVDSVAEVGRPIFVDAKLHDIPNTVKQAARGLGARGARWVTVHSAGGPAMIRAAVDGLNETSRSEAGVLAVTILTSIDPTTMSLLGIAGTLEERVASYASMALQAGAEGVVCSVGECSVLRKALPGVRLFTPGIRGPGQTSHDQARVDTPAAAAAAGADFLVVGRAVTEADDPFEAARAILLEIRG
jgi:orotidine-5'-phosphate decarboxylase